MSSDGLSAKKLGLPPSTTPRANAAKYARLTRVIHAITPAEVTITALIYHDFMAADRPLHVHKHAVAAALSNAGMNRQVTVALIAAVPK